VLELETKIDGVKINAVDIISWNSEDRINHFKVMVRPTWSGLSASSSGYIILVADLLGLDQRAVMQGP
jgi:hypothetical protein